MATSETIEQLLKDFPVKVEINVKWGEMDAFQHVNNTVYFRYFEDLRIAYFNRLGYFDLKKSSVGPILAATSCKFIKPLTFPDTVTIGGKTMELGEDRFKMMFRVVSRKMENTVAEGDALIVSYDYAQGKKAPVQPEIRKAIMDLEGMTGE